MPVKKPRPHTTKAHAKHAAQSGTAVRQRVRDLSVRAFRDRDLSLNELPRIVNDVLEGAVQGIDNSVPSNGRNVLRQVFDGLREGVNTVASAGKATAKDARSRARTVSDKHYPDAARRISAANDQFLSAVQDFASKTSRGVRDDLDDFVDRARRTGSKLAGTAKGAASASEGHLLDLAGETARAGVRAARRAANALAQGAGGLFEGLAAAIGTKPGPAPARTAPKRRVASRKKSASKKKPARKKT
jgi:Family of unknown function (DUF6781)